MRKDVLDFITNKLCINGNVANKMPTFIYAFYSSILLLGTLSYLFFLQVNEFCWGKGEKIQYLLDDLQMNSFFFFVCGGWEGDKVIIVSSMYACWYMIWSLWWWWDEEYKVCLGPVERNKICSEKLILCKFYETIFLYVILCLPRHFNTFNHYSIAPIW